MYSLNNSVKFNNQLLTLDVTPGGYLLSLHFLFGLLKKKVFSAAELGMFVEENKLFGTESVHSSHIHPPIVYFLFL